MIASRTKQGGICIDLTAGMRLGVMVVWELLASGGLDGGEACLLLLWTGMGHGDGF